MQTGDLDVADADSLLDALALASAAEVTPNRWFINGADFIALRKLKDGQQRYLLESDVTKDVTYRLFGIPVTVTNKLAEGKAVLADTAQIADNESLTTKDIAPWHDPRAVDNSGKTARRPSALLRCQVQRHHPERTENRCCITAFTPGEDEVLAETVGGRIL